MGRSNEGVPKGNGLFRPHVCGVAVTQVTGDAVIIAVNLSHGYFFLSSQALASARESNFPDMGVSCGPRTINQPPSRGTFLILTLPLIGSDSNFVDAPILGYRWHPV